MRKSPGLFVHEYKSMFYKECPTHYIELDTNGGDSVKCIVNNN